MVIVVIAAAGIVTALFKGVALNDRMLYPLSRLQRARLAYRTGLVDIVFLSLVLGLGLYVIGSLTGLLVGYEVRFDFIPLYLRALMLTLILMPLGQRGRLDLQALTRRKAENTIVLVVLAVVGFIVAVTLGVFLLPRILLSPIQELTALVAGIGLSQWINRSWLVRYYRRADLAKRYLRGLRRTRVHPWLTINPWGRKKKVLPSI